MHLIEINRNAVPLNWRSTDISSRLGLYVAEVQVPSNASALSGITAQSAHSAFFQTPTVDGEYTGLKPVMMSPLVSSIDRFVGEHIERKGMKPKKKNRRPSPSIKQDFSGEERIQIPGA